MPLPLFGPVFVSYSRMDNDVMRRIVTFLRKRGIKTWVDNEKLTPGTPIWEEEIEKAIKGASAIIVVLSPDSKVSEWVRREISLADQNHKRIFPVLVRGDEDTSMSLRLITRQYVDLRRDEEKGLDSLYTALSQYLDEQKTQLKKKDRTEGEPTLIKETETIRETSAQEESSIEPVTTPMNPLSKGMFLGLGGIVIAVLALGYLIFANSPAQVGENKKSGLVATPEQQDCPDGMILIPASSFKVGTSEDDPYYQERPGELPSRIINLSNYCIDKTEVSNEKYTEFVEAKNREWTMPAKNDIDLPVTKVSWFDGMAYCEWKGEQLGIKLKLPNEFQWEKAARGPDGKIYPWGNTWIPDMANAEQTQPTFSLAPVISYKDGQSDYGVLNMSGNVSEWVEDWYHVDRYFWMHDGDSDPKASEEPNGADTKVVKGGSTNDSKIDVRAAVRLDAYGPYEKRLELGFRCATDYLP
jgi:sulfatase modifying factor 1